MAKIFFTSRYYKNPARSNVGKLLRYVSFPQSCEYEEYKTYSDEPSKSNATNFINAVTERNDVSRLDKLVSYIAERPGVEKLGSHGLFSQTDDKIDLNEAAEEVNNNGGTVFTHIISLRREDAERLGYNNAKAWRNLIRRNVTEMAVAHNISLSNMKWYAGFHDKDHHPHIHLIVYSRDGKQGWITKKSIEDMRSLFGNDIFRNEQYKLFQTETQQRDMVKERVKGMLEDVISVFPVYEEMQVLFETLQKQLRDYTGKKVYGYLPKNIKETVNKIVAEFAKDEDVAELYAEWNKINREKLSLYYEKKEPDIPLEDNKEFRSLKNDIIRAAIKSDTYLVDTGYSSEQRIGFLMNGVFRSFLRLFQNSYDRHADRFGKQIDRKLMSMIREKKAAHGIKTEQGLNYGYNEQSM